MTAPPRPSSSPLPLLLGLALLARLITFGNPIVFVDEEFYLTAARTICHGALPYVDVWDRKPVGLFLLYLPAGCARLPLGVWVYQAMAVGAVVGTALLIVRLAARAGWRAGAVPAAALYILWLNFADGQGGQAPVFYNPMVAGAALLTIGAANAQRRRMAGLAAMLLVGGAMQIKYAAMFEGVWFGLWLLWVERRAAGWGAAVAHGAALVAAALLPTALAAGAYAALGQWPAFLYANFVSILARSPDPLSEQLDNLTTAAGILLPLLGIAAAGLIGRADTPSPERRFLRGWAIAAIGGFAAFGSWFNHYTLPVLVPLTICAAGSIVRQRWSRRTVGIVLGIAFIAGQGVLLSERHIRGLPSQFAAISRAVGHGPGALYVYSGSSLYYAVADRPVLTPYLFPSHLQTARENGAVGVSQRRETARILAARPAVVVIQSLDGGERSDLHGAVIGWLAAHGYQVAAQLPLGNKHVDVWRDPYQR